MKREQFLLMKLAEECVEVAQRAIKQAQFGANQIQKAAEVKDGVPAPDKEAGLTNAERLQGELIDLAVILGLLGDANQIPVPPTIAELNAARAIKIEKLNKYLALSRSLGEIDGDWTI